MKVIDKGYCKHIQYYSEFVPTRLRFLVKDKNIIRLLDLGCGDGAILFALKKQGLLKNKEIIAVDISKDRIAKTQNIDSKFRCFVADACDLNKIIKKKSLDLVISSQVIEHVENVEQFVRQVEQILKTGGLFYLSTVFKKRYGWYFYRNNNRKWVLDPTHLREFQHEEELVPVFEKLGFKVVQNHKILWKFPITDFFLKRLGFRNDIYQKNWLLGKLRTVKIPILGYYYWELIFKKI